MTSGSGKGDGMVDLPLRSDDPPDLTFDPIEGAGASSGPSPDRSIRPTRKKSKWPVVLGLALLLAILVLVFMPGPPRVQFEPESLDAGSVRVGESGPDLLVTVQNSGERSLKVRGLQFEGESSGEHFKVLDENCVGVKIPALASCQAGIRFEPQAPGDLTTRLLLVGNDRKAPGLQISAVATAPALGMDPGNLDFGVVPLDSDPVESAVSLTNIGTAVLELGRIRLEGPAASDFKRSKRCPDPTLEPGEACSFEIRFEPSVSGARSALLVVESDSFEGSSTLKIGGTGLWDGPPLDPVEDVLNLGEQRLGIRSQSKRVRFSNRTGGDVVIDGARIEGTSTIAIVKDGCGDKLVPSGEGCSVSLTFLPVNDGRVNGVLSLSARGASQQSRVELRGRGVTPKMTVETANVGFSDQRTGFESSVQTLRFRNTGTATLTPGKAAVVGEHRSDFKVRANGCTGKALAAGKSCSVGVGFLPSRPGARAALLELDPGSGLPGAKVELVGDGVVSALAVDRSRIDFGQVYVGRPGSATLRLTNEGTARLELQRLRVDGEDAGAFQVVRIGCALDAGLAPGESCEVEVGFRPGQVSARSAVLILEYNGPDSPARVQLFGSGREREAAFTLSASAVSFSPVAAGRRSDIRTLTISNPGAAWLSLASISLRGEHAEDFEIVAGTCDGATAIAPGGSCTVGLRFAPGTVGRRAGTLLVRHGAAGSPAAVELGGTATAVQ